MIQVTDQSIEPNRLLQAFRAERGDVGALASFVGYVRDGAGDVEALELDCYPGFTEAEIAKIEAEARARFDLLDVLIVHRFGRMGVGEPIVVAAALSAHRADAFQGVAFLMDYLKTDAPFWKKEIGPGGDRWVEPREDDHAARRAWES